VISSIDVGADLASRCINVRVGVKLVVRPRRCVRRTEGGSRTNGTPIRQPERWRLPRPHIVGKRRGFCCRVGGGGRRVVVRCLRPPYRTARAVFPQAALNGCSPSGGSSHACWESVAEG
jgi:hypothetical protein